MMRSPMGQWMKSAFRRGDTYLNALGILVYVVAHVLLCWCVHPFSSRYARKIRKRVLNDSFQEEIRKGFARFDEIYDNDDFCKGE